MTPIITHVCLPIILSLLAINDLRHLPCCGYLVGMDHFDGNEIVKIGMMNVYVLLLRTMLLPKMRSALENLVPLDHKVAEEGAIGRLNSVTTNQRMLCGFAVFFKLFN